MKKSDNSKIQITRRVPQKARILLISMPAWVDDCAYELSAANTIMQHAGI